MGTSGVAPEVLFYRQKAVGQMELIVVIFNQRIPIPGREWND
jgi:hypothetical protein